MALFSFKRRPDSVSPLTAVLGKALLASVVALITSVSRAEEGVAADSITVSRVIALSGPAGAKGREQEAALKAYFTSLNAAGGVHGRKIVLRTVDEDLKTDDALRRIVELHRPFAFFLFGGTTGSAVAMKFADQYRVPFVAPNSGAGIFHTPPHRQVFNVRARYRDEVVAAVEHFALVNQRRLALLHVDDSFGHDAAAGFDEGLALGTVTAVYRGTLGDRADDARHIRSIADGDVQAVICIGSSKRVADFIAAARAAGSRAVFMTLSNNSSSGFARDLGTHARGVIVSQITPPAATSTTRLSRELRALLAATPNADVSYAAMEAYASAKVLVEGLRRAGPNLTREGYVQALEGMRRFDLGGLEVEYGPQRRTGSTYVELSILTADGRYLR